MKHISIFLFFFCVLLSAEQDGTQWVRSVQQNCSATHCLQLAEWLDAAIERSRMTTEAQKIYLEFLESTWERWENLMWTRRNPSRSLPYTIVTPDGVEQFASFERAIVQYHAAGRSYDRITEELLAEGGAVAAALREARSQAMQAVWYGLCDHYTDINEAYEKGRAALNNATQQLCRHDRLYIGRRWWHSVMSWVPRWIKTVFARFDDGYTAASADCFGALLVSQRASVVLWETIEQARLQWYTTARKALDGAAKDL